jgi:hypothetical protein
VSTCALVSHASTQHSRTRSPAHAAGTVISTTATTTRYYFAVTASAYGRAGGSGAYAEAIFQVQGGQLLTVAVGGPGTGYLQPANGTVSDTPCVRTRRCAFSECARVHMVALVCREMWQRVR